MCGKVWERVIHTDSLGGLALISRIMRIFLAFGAQTHTRHENDVQAMDVFAIIKLLRQSECSCLVGLGDEVWLCQKACHSRL